jgi:chemotaxis protein CheD
MANWRYNMQIVVGIGEFAISNKECDVIKTHALGSCIALTAYSRLKKVLGMVHIALPDSKIDLSNRVLRPFHFADSAVELLLEKLTLQFDCKKNELVFNIYGGAECVGSNDIFKIGQRNIIAVKKNLELNGITLNEEQVGGNYSRTIEAYVATGDIKMFSYPLHFKTC